MSKDIIEESPLRALPSVDLLLRTPAAQALKSEIGAERLSLLARRVTNELRTELLSKPAESRPQDGFNGLREKLIGEAEKRLTDLHQSQKASGLTRVINATGVVLHTNLGRAPLSAAAKRAIEAATGYCSLEYDVITGARGRRGGRTEDLLIDLTGAEAALVVNNCAAAALLVLSTLARDGETIVSRGELVEIGGDFRVPDVMAQSGTRMVEVGTTNRTSLTDFRKAISEDTRLVMRVHTSNYRIVGFTNAPSLAELVDLAHEARLPVYEDAGSGAIVDFAEYGVEGEPVIRQSLSAGVDVISFSGDKLLGGPQSGLLVGRAEVIERMRRNALYRALRADKLRVAALEATLEAYARGEAVPSRAMIAMPFAEIERRANELINSLKNSNVVLSTVKGESAVGGGSAPISPLPLMKPISI